MPSPLKSLTKLDYCWKLNYTLWKHSFVLGVPSTMVVFIWRNMPQCWSYTRKTFPFKVLALNYLQILLAVNAVNSAYSLAFEPYCRRDSDIYDINDRSLNKLR